MISAAGYLAKLKAENLGRTFKVQDTSHRAVANTLYRGAAGCGPINYNQIKYPYICPCAYRGLAKRFSPIIPTLPDIIDGGTPAAPGSTNFDGGTPAGSGSSNFDGGQV